LLNVILAVSLPACRQAPAPGFTPPRAVVDLSPVIGEDAPSALIGHKFLRDFGLPESTVFHRIYGEDPYYYEDSKIEIFTHVGPHHDAPSHIIKGARATDTFGLDQFIGVARVLDFRDKPKDSALTRADFERHGIQPDDIVIAYVGYVPPTGDAYPSFAYLSGEAAEYLATLPVRLFATDMPSLAGLKHVMEILARKELKGAQNIVPEHYAFASHNVPSIEGLVNLDRIVGEREVVFVGFPLRIKDGDAGPMRAAALVY
jgi:arylformamidase